MKKIKINSRIVKKTVLWALLVCVVAFLSFITIDSFSLEHISSNNTSPASSQLSGEYGNYVNSKEQNYPQGLKVEAEFNVALTNEKNSSGSVNTGGNTGDVFTFDGTDYIYSGKSGSVIYTVNILQEGFYNILVDYVPAINKDNIEENGIDVNDAKYRGIIYFDNAESSGGAAIERSILVDGVIPYDDLSNVSFQRVWGDGGDKLIDMSGNEIKPKQVEIPQAQEAYVRDQLGYVTEPYMVYLTAGSHEVEIASIRENMCIAHLYLTSKETYQGYDEYYEYWQSQGAQKVDGTISYKIQGEGGTTLKTVGQTTTAYEETTVRRSSSTIYGTSDRTSAYNSIVQNGEELPASPVKLVLNTIGGSKWSTPGDWISWSLNVEEAGFYQISLRSKQNVSRGLFSTRKLMIDGTTPFNEAQNCKFVYGSNWSIVTIGSSEEEPYYFYLDEGVHTISLECTLGDYSSEISKIQDVIDELNRLYRRIIQKTGISPDPYIDYFRNEEGKKFISEAQTKFNECIDVLYEVSDQITKISGEKSSETSSLETMAVQLRQFVDDYRKIQRSLSDFSTNISSLGTWILSVSQQSLLIDYLVVHTDSYELPKANPNIFVSTWFSIRGFFQSFFFDYESVGRTATNSDWETIEVWLLTSETTGREQANAISTIISEESNDPSSDIYGFNIVLKVVSPDVLLTATLAGKGPDVAINAYNGTPVNYALRSATYDLTNFSRSALDAAGLTSIPSFEEITMNDDTKWFQQSAMVPYEFEGGYYALPYTQSFLVLFYRTDMFEEYGWRIPQTWEHVIDLIPELQLMNFQFYLPLNTVGAASVVNQIFASYLYQSLDDARDTAFYRRVLNQYGEEFLESNFDSEEAMKAFEFWCSFYTDYSFPLSASFINRFRSGETPIGISGYDLYNTLSVSAPEIRGKWSFALLPGLQKTTADGQTYVDHSGAASGTSIIMMANGEEKATAKHPYESWRFMEWFTSSDIQVTYAREIEAILGSAARHNTANVDAFYRLAWTEEEKAILGEQWESTIGVPEVAGGYYTGRNLENAFRYVVNNNENPRQTLSDYILTINSEIDRKREEFGLATSTTRSTSK